MNVVLVVVFALFAIHGAFLNAVDAERVTRSAGSRMNGENADIADYTFRVNIVMTTTVLCSGVILTAGRVLTSAYCASIVGGIPVPINVVAGMYNLNDNMGREQTKIAISQVQHEGFNPVTTENDLAILVLDSDFEFNEYVQAATLPTRRAAKTCFASGFNFTGGSGDLNELETEVIGRKRCRKMARKVDLDHRLHATNVCTYAEGGIACTGDFGSPLMCYDKKQKVYALAGIMSWGIGAGTCEEGEFVYQAVFKYLDWINANI